MIYSERSALIVGAGAVGAVLGAHLLSAGWHVTFRVRPESFLGYRRLGLLIHSATGQQRIDGERFVCDAVAPGSHALVLLCTKMPDLEKVLDGLAHDDDGKRIYITVQNGLAAPDMVVSLFGYDRVLAGAAVVNAIRTGLGEIEVMSDARRLTLAPLRARTTLVARDIAARLHDGGIDARAVDGATGLLWSKFVGIEPLATTCALTRMNLGEVRRTPHALVMLRGLFEEVFAVGRGVGVSLNDELYVRRWRSFFDGPEQMRPSLARDMEARRAHELQWLTGTVVNLADRAEIPAPLHRRALRMLTRGDALHAAPVGHAA